MTKPFYKEINNEADYFISAANTVIDWNAVAHCEQDEMKIVETFTPERFNKQISYVEEELKEYRDAVKEKDEIEMLDALADIFVTASYLTYMFFGKEHMEKFLELPVGDVISEDPYETWVTILESSPENQLMGMISATFMRQARDSLVRTHYNGKKVMKEVLRSNYTKYPTAKQLKSAWGTNDIEQALSKECQYIEDNSRYSGITYKYNSFEERYIFFSDAGKIVKPSTFSAADLRSVLKIKGEINAE